MTPNRVKRTVLSVAARAGIALAVLDAGVPLIGGGWCWVQLQYLILFAIGSALLLRFKRWEALIVGACCWFYLFLGFNAAARSGFSERLSYPTLVIAFLTTITGNTWIVAKCLWGLPARRAWLPLLLSFLLVGVTLLVQPYWIARFHGARANLRSASLAMTDLHGADLREADLDRANLHGACLQEANLKSANLAGADLRSTCLDGVDLTGADLTGALVNGALFDRETTHWPAHFDPEAHGARERVWL